MERNTCRGCGSIHLNLVHDFGKQPLAGEFPSIPEAIQAANRYTLDLTQCCNCGLLQVCNLPPISKIFHDDYRYSSSTIPGLVQHFKSYSDWLSVRIPPGARILEFGCNDGILLMQLSSKGYECKGVDASANIVSLAKEKGLDVDVGFFGRDYVQMNEFQGRFDLITCSNVYAHIDDLSGVTIAAYNALKEGGMFAIEVHDGASISAQGQFDTIYHEHLTYFTQDSLTRHLQTHGFHVLEVAQTSMHGGGLRILSKRLDTLLEEKISPHLSEFLMSDQLIQQDLKKSCADVLELRSMHSKLWGYGAAGRSQMFLNFTKTSDLFECVYDDSPLRQGRFIVASDLPIRAFEKTKHDGACVILSWNYADEIVKKIAPFFDAIYTALPKVKRWV